MCPIPMEGVDTLDLWSRGRWPAIQMSVKHHKALVYYTNIVKSQTVLVNNFFIQFFISIIDTERLWKFFSSFLAYLQDLSL